MFQRILRDNLPRIIAPRDTIRQLQFATIIGGLWVKLEDYMKLLVLGVKFKIATNESVKMLKHEVNEDEVIKTIYNYVLNYVYAESILKQAKAIVESLKFTGGKSAFINRPYIYSRGNKYDKGNRNIRLISTDRVLIKYHDGSWIEGYIKFKDNYHSLLNELISLANMRKEGYGARVVFRDSLELHVNVPLYLYVKHLGSPRNDIDYSKLLGIDLNSDRVNGVIINNEGRIVNIYNKHFHEVTSHGYPKGKAREVRLKSLFEVIDFAVRRYGIGFVVFENLFNIKYRRCTLNPKANRKITRFAKKQLLVHGIIQSLKKWCNVILVNPHGTTHSKEHNIIMRRYGLDKHTASAYIIALKGLKKIQQLL